MRIYDQGVKKKASCLYLFDINQGLTCEREAYVVYASRSRVLLDETEVPGDLLPRHVGDVDGVAVAAVVHILARGHDDVDDVAVAGHPAAVKHHSVAHDGVVAVDVELRADLALHLTVVARDGDVGPVQCGVLADERLVVDRGRSTGGTAAHGDATAAELAQHLRGLLFGHAADDTLSDQVTLGDGPLVVVDDPADARGQPVVEQLLEELLLGELVQVSGHGLVTGDQCPVERLQDPLVQFAENQAEAVLVGVADVDELQRDGVDHHHAGEIERLVDGDGVLPGDLADRAAELGGEVGDVLHRLVHVHAAVGVRNDDLVRALGLVLGRPHVFVGLEEVEHLGGVTLSLDRQLEQFLDRHLAERGRRLQDELLGLAHFSLLVVDDRAFVGKRLSSVKQCN